MANTLKKAAGRLAAKKSGAKTSTDSDQTSSVKTLKGKAAARKAKRQTRSLR